MGTNAKQLGAVTVAKPCQRAWDSMIGGNRSRYCGDCKLNVYNLSEMTSEEALALIAQKEGELCVRFFERADGTVITRDCPVGVSKHRRKVVTLSVATASVLSFTAAAAYVGEAMETEHEPACDMQPPPPELTTTAATTAPANPEDTSWMEKRRSQLGPREYARQVTGRLHTIQVIGPKKE